MTAKRIWVVEMFNRYVQRWQPTVGVGLTREDARQEQALWATKNPYDKFRVHCYVSTP